MMSWIQLSDKLLLDTFAEINQILLNIYSIPILLTFMYVSSNNLSENWAVNKSMSTQTRTQLIVATIDGLCDTCQEEFPRISEKMANMK